MSKKVKISKYYLQKCLEFADLQVEGSKNLYAYRGESRVDKIISDIVIGKTAEVGVMTYLKNLGYGCSKPDFSIYERQRKSFDADLYTDCGLQIHVKAQGLVSHKRYGASWLLQKSDKITSKPSTKDYMIMVLVDGQDCTILGVCRVADIVPCLGEPRVPSYRHTKKALYLEDLKVNNVNLSALRRKR